jgi:hypothetical protein
MNNEPVAWIAIGDNTSVFFDLDCALAIDDNPTPLYRHPSEHDLGIAEAIGFDKGYKAATAKTLTHEEITQVFNDCYPNNGDGDVVNLVDFARAILRKAQEK